MNPSEFTNYVAVYRGKTNPPVFECFVNEEKKLCIGYWSEDGKPSRTVVLSKSPSYYHQDEFVDNNSTKYVFQTSWQVIRLRLEVKKDLGWDTFELERMSEFETSLSSMNEMSSSFILSISSCAEIWKQLKSLVAAKATLEEAAERSQKTISELQQKLSEQVFA